MSAESDGDDSGLPAGVSHVLVSTSKSGKKHYHRPDPDDPSRPECNATLRRAGADWEKKTHPRQLVFRERCAACVWPGDGPPRGREWRDEATLRELYVHEDLAVREIARRLGCTNRTIRNWLARHGLREGDSA